MWYRQRNVLARQTGRHAWARNCRGYQRHPALPTAQAFCAPHVLGLLGGGAWELHAASGYRFDDPESGEADKAQGLSHAPAEGLVL